MPWEAAPRIERLADMGLLAVEETPEAILITGDAFSVAFDRIAGEMHSFQVRGKELLDRGPRLNLWRATTDNDRGRHRAEPVAETWVRAGLDRLRHLVREVSTEPVSEHAVRVTIREWLSAPETTFGFASGQVYTIFGSGDVVIDVAFDPAVRHGVLPRLGLQLRLAAGLETMTWFGRGPQESYIDRLAGASVGRYIGTVDEQYVPYVMPQENGNKTDVRWVTLTDEKGVGLLAAGRPYLEVSAHHYTTENLTRAMHTNELDWEPEVTLNLDYRQMGLGGASCGPATRPEYVLPIAPTRFQVRLRGLDGQESPEELARQLPPPA